MTDSSRKITLMADVVAPALTVALTLVLFGIFAPADATALYWFNMAYTALLELLLFGYLRWLPASGPTTSVALKVIFGGYTLAYVAGALCWLLLYSTALTSLLSLKVYFSVIAVATVLWILCASLTLKADVAHTESVRTMSHRRDLADTVEHTAAMLASQFAIMQNAHPELLEARPAFDRLIHGLQSVSPAVMASPGADTRLLGICTELESAMKRSFSEHTPSELKSLCETQLITLNFIKQSARR